MKTAILGMGGIGGVVGAALASQYTDIHFIARGKTLEAIEKNGIVLKSEILGDITVKPASVTDSPEKIGTVDVLIISTKSYGLEAALNQCNPIIGDNTVIIPLLNGVNISWDVESIIGKKALVADGCIYTFANILEPGVIRQSGKILNMVFGFKDGHKSETLNNLSDMLIKSGIPAAVSENIMVPVWEKYTMMCGNSCIFSYFDSSAGDIQKDAEKMKFVKNTYMELVSLAKLSGVNLNNEIADKYTATFKTLPPDTVTSLYRDIRAGNKNTEFNSIIGKAYHISQSFKADTPCIDAAYEKNKGR